VDEKEFQQKLGDLLAQIDSLPESERSVLQQVAEETRSRHDRMKKTINELQDSLDYLRLSIKYLVFDLEATRRENQYLRKLLERQSGQQDGSGDDA
jgi:BMFP domain-containing protein YqiC